MSLQDMLKTFTWSKVKSPADHPVSFTHHKINMVDIELFLYILKSKKTASIISIYTCHLIDLFGITLLQR